MEFFHNAYLNFFSIGALIPTTFHLFTAFFFLSIAKKSKATFHLGMFYLFMFLFNLGYFICATFYHPLAAYHRWLTVGVILLSEAHYNMTTFHFPDEGNRIGGRILLAVQYVVAIAAIAVFYYATAGGSTIYRFDGHYWDFDAEGISKIISLIIILYILINIVLTIYRVVTDRAGQRWLFLLLLGCYLVSTIIPSVFNTLSRDGAMDRETFQISWDLFNILGFFLIAIIYMNTTRERVSFIGKLIGISLVTFMTFIQFLSYVTLQDLEKSYDEARRRDLALAVGNVERAGDLQYLMVFRPGERRFVEGREALPPFDRRASSVEMSNTFIYEELRALPCENFGGALTQTLTDAPPSFAGYRAAIAAIKPAADGCEYRARVLAHIDGIQRTLYHRSNKIRALPDAGFRAAIGAFLQSTSSDFAPFRGAIAEELAASKLEGRALKEALLDRIRPMRPAGHRTYRQSSDGREHFVAFLQVDLAHGRVYEAGFSYLEYRRYAHPSVLKYLIMFVVLVLVVRFGFNVLFSGALIKPLWALLDGVRAVNAGNLDTSVPVKLSDEIGYISHVFNKMVASIRESKHILEEYAQNLECKVEERTRELKSARDALWGEMQLAKKIQTVLLPQNPEIPGYEIAAYMSPTDEVGGDYYDIINVEGIDWIVIGDVSGHGIPAGLIMMMVQTAIHTVLAGTANLKPGVVLSRINKVITGNVKRLGEDKYMTITVMACVKDGRFFHSGLHLDILLYRAASGTVEAIGTNGMWLGLMDDIRELVDGDRFSMAVGDTMLLYTDGITEAFRKGVDRSNPDEAMFGEERLATILREHGSGSPENVKAAVILALHDYDIRDDVTLLCLKRLR